MSRFRSLVISLVALVAMGVALALKVSLADNHIDASEWVQIGIAAVAAFQVWLTKNEPGWTWAKSGTAAALAILSLLVGLIAGGLNALEITNLVIAGLAALGIRVIPNEPETPTKASRRR